MIFVFFSSFHIFIHLLFSLIYRPATSEVISKEMRLKMQENKQRAMERRNQLQNQRAGDSNGIALRSDNVFTNNNFSQVHVKPPNYTKRAINSQSLATTSK